MLLTRSTLYKHRRRMLPRILMSVAFLLGLSSAAMDEEKVVVCVGQDFQLPLQSRTRVVFFTPSSDPGSGRVVLEGNEVKDPRYEWTDDMILQAREVMGKDRGVFNVKTSSGIVHRKIRLTVKDCIKNFTLFYGDNFEEDVTNGGAVVEFSPKSSQSPTQAVILWTREAGGLRNVRWNLKGVTQKDQGDYTVRDAAGQFLYKIRLTVEEHVSAYTLSPNESLTLPLFLHSSNSHLTFIPTSSSSSSSSLYALYPPRPAVPLVRDGQIVTKEERYRGRVALAQTDGTSEIVIARLRFDDSGVYEIRDGEGNLVSSTRLEVVKKTRWKSIFKSVTFPLGLIGFMATVIYFKRKYPSWGSLRNAPRNTTFFSPQVYSEPCTFGTVDGKVRLKKVFNNFRCALNAYSDPIAPNLPIQPPLSRAQANWNHIPLNTGHPPVTAGVHSPSTTREQEREGETGEMRGEIINNLIPAAEENFRERQTSFSFPSSSDCLHSSTSCVRFQLEEVREKEEEKDREDHFLSSDTPGTCSIYTSDKHNFL